MNEQLRTYLIFFLYFSLLVGNQSINASTIKYLIKPNKAINYNSGSDNDKVRFTYTAQVNTETFSATNWNIAVAAGGAISGNTAENICKSIDNESRFAVTWRWSSYPLGYFNGYGTSPGVMYYKLGGTQDATVPRSNMVGPKFATWHVLLCYATDPTISGQISSSDIIPGSDTTTDPGKIVWEFN